MQADMARPGTDQPAMLQFCAGMEDYASFTTVFR